MFDDSLDHIELVAPLFLLRLYQFLLIFAKTLARLKIMVQGSKLPLAASDSQHF